MSIGLTFFRFPDAAVVVLRLPRETTKTQILAHALETALLSRIAAEDVAGKIDQTVLSRPAAHASQEHRASTVDYWRRLSNHPRGICSLLERRVI